VGDTQPLFDAFEDGSMLFNGGDVTFSQTYVLSYGAYEVGWRKIPIVTAAEAPAVESLRGKCARAEGDVTVPVDVFSAGDVVTIINIIANAPISIIPGAGFGLILAGSNTQGTRTLANNGICTVFFLSATQALISGTGVT
jgi:hypothetical protein